MKGLTLVLAIVSFLLYSSVVYADIYMHNPAGSNNRNCERNENRNNGARLFDSQNNGKGGYACPRAVGGPEVDSIDKRMFYYQGSLLQVEWTSQHSCGATNNYCHIVLQYACEDSLPGLRDGQPKDENDAATSTIELDDEDNLNYGKHENGTYYKKCLKRYRQGGLFLADRQTENPGRLKSNSPATQTRQNPNGARSGLECPEERDYYPYWHPTPWRDIAIFTNDLSQCNMYRSESQNVKDKGECYDEKDNSYMSHNNYFDCTTNGGVWKESGRWGVSPPECLSTDLIKAVDNSLGNTDNGNMAKYIWKIPYDIASDSCVLRIRYNISTDDVPFDLDHKYNNEASPIKQDPFDTFGHNSFLSIAANTDQFGRTFQDRSYVFSIKERPAKTSGKIWNVNVKGKRGNIVQTYPAVEYKFVPEYLEVSSNDWIHFQWTGSDYNPDRDPNNAEGGPVDKADKSDNPATRADRSNLVQLDYAGTSVPRPAQFNTMFVNPSTGKPDMTLINKFALINQDLSKCLSWEDLLAANNNNKDKAEKDSRNCAKLNAADHPYFNGGLVKLHASGTFHYFSSRNNNFSNRGQKATIRVVGGNIAGASTLSSTMAFIVTVMSVMFLYIW